MVIRIGFAHASDFGKIETRLEDMKENFLVRHMVQIVAAVIIAATLSYIPYAIREGDPNQSSLAITVFLVFVLVFEINKTIAKHQDLKRNINLELSRVRRIHHLGESMTTRKSKWVQSVNKALDDYLLFFKKHTFRDYRGAGERFRDLTHVVYDFKPKSRREELLYLELLGTTRELAQTRQNIAALIRQRISSYQWIVVLIILALVIISALLTQNTGMTAYLLNASLLSAIFIVTFLIWEVDDYNEDELRQFANLYVENKKSLDKERKR